MRLPSTWVFGDGSDGVVVITEGRCTLFGEGVLTRGLSTCSVSELRELYNAPVI
jgi:hypothetical protein